GPHDVRRRPDDGVRRDHRRVPSLTSPRSRSDPRRITMTTIEELRSQSDRTNNVRKSLRARIFAAPLTVEVIDSLTDETGGIVALPDGSRSLGLFSRDAISLARETDTEATEAHGYMSPVREDITSISRTITATAYEVDRRIIREISDGVDL